MQLYDRNAENAHEAASITHRRGFILNFLINLHLPYPVVVPLGRVSESNNFLTNWSSSTIDYHPRRQSRVFLSLTGVVTWASYQRNVLEYAKDCVGSLITPRSQGVIIRKARLVVDAKQDRV